MRRLWIVVFLGLLSWQGYQYYEGRTARTAAPPEPLIAPVVAESPIAPVIAAPAPTVSQYKCDGRVYCSQMTSCEEATYFLRNCPGVKMDGDNDGVPCEEQWCKG
jgi:hypothetical protein